MFKSPKEKAHAVVVVPLLIIVIIAGIALAFAEVDRQHHDSTFARRVVEADGILWRVEISSAYHTIRYREQDWHANPTWVMHERVGEVWMVYPSYTRAFPPRERKATQRELALWNTVWR